MYRTTSSNLALFDTNFGRVRRVLKLPQPDAGPSAMSRRNVSIVVVVMALVASAQGATFSRSGASRGQAEQNVLRFLGKGWRGHQLPRLFDPRTHLLRDNTQAICRRSGGRHSAGRFLCVVPPPH